MISGTASRPLAAVALLAILFLPASIMVSRRYPVRGWQMPFDNPHQTPFGDLELLMEARGRISSRDTWVQGHFQKRGRYCLVASLSLTCGSRRFGMSKPAEQRLCRLLASRCQPTRHFGFDTGSCGLHDAS